MNKNTPSRKHSGTGKPGKTAGKRHYPGSRPSFKKKETEKKPEDQDSIRLNKYIANSGVCSRRDADIYIASGNVTVNGEVITEMGHKVSLSDMVYFDGRRITPEKKEYVLLNKPGGFITTTKDEKGRKTVMNLISGASKSRLLPVGRLDRNTTGLLLFTNDGELAKKLTHPRHGIRKLYHVVLNKNLKQEDLKKIETGLTLEDGPVKVDEISYITDAPKREVGVTLHSGKNRIVRRIFEALGYEVIKLDRVIFAGLTKKKLPKGTWRYLTKQEIINLKML